MSSVALATAAFAGLTADAQTKQSTQKAEHDHSSSDPEQENKVLLGENPNSNNPPPTDHGDVVPLWYSFDLVKKRVEEGGWTHEVTERVLPSSKDIAGVNMRLTARSYRELHWHTADEWAYVLYGKARLTVMNPDWHDVHRRSKHIAAALIIVKPGGMRELHWHPNASEWQFYIAGKGRMTVFFPVGNARTMDFNANDVGYVPSNAPHYIENTGDTELVFLETFASEQFMDVSLNQWLRRVPSEMLKAHLNIDKETALKIPAEKLAVI
jgi:oxalate decarboxylase/phosphoglucose isomerase-like protein (cupin superfamily)